MTPRWRLEVEGLGKIERAEVDVRPLTLFVGPNNSGKSYLASLLWGLVAMQGDLEPPEGPDREAVDAWLQKNLPRDQFLGRIDLGAEDLARLDALFQTALTDQAGRLSSRVFNSESVRVGGIRFRNLSPERRLRLESERFGKFYRLAVDAPDSGFGVTFTADRVSDRVSDEEIIQMARGMLMRHAVLGRLARHTGPFVDEYNESSPIFLPASRTGFMQLYKAAARRSLRGAFRRGSDDVEWLDLTTPAFHFIDMLAFGLKAKSTDIGDFAEEADFLEGHITGRIERVEALGVNEYRYHPAGGAGSLTMSLSSALVTELAPLVLVLRYHLTPFSVLVLEEPEAHLHPELQRKLAQVIVRLVRKGLVVWITTHSDYFCQELNIFLKLGALPADRRAEAQQKLGYGEQDFLKLEEVAGHELRLDERGERSTVVEMKRTEAGLVMPTFNRSIVRLNKDVTYLDMLLSGDDA